MTLGTYWTIAVIAVGIVAIAFAKSAQYEEPPVVFMMTMLGGLLCALVVSLALDGMIFGRQTWAAQIACKQQRGEPERQFFTKNVVCVPAYRGTKNDTLTVQTPDIKR